MILRIENRRNSINSIANEAANIVATNIQSTKKHQNLVHKASAKPKKKGQGNYVRDIASMQKALWDIGAFKGVKDRHGREATLETAVDGIDGSTTQQALANAKRMGYVLKNSRFIKNPNNSNKTDTSSNKKQPVTTSGANFPSLVILSASNSTKPYVQEAADWIGHNPALILLEDVDRASSNRLMEGLFGTRPFNGRVITNLPSLQKEELIKQVNFAKSLGKSLFDSDLYNKMYSYNYGSKTGYNNEDRSGIFNRMSSPRARLEHTLGLYNFYVDKDGNTIVTDTYDFNTNQKQHGEGRYVNIRNNIAGTFASRDTDPESGKIRYKINLGKL